MANNIKGITVEIGGKTSALTTALKDVNKTSRDLQGELREVNKQLKFDPGNTTLLQQKQKLLAESVTNTKNKLETLKEAEKQAQRQLEEGKIGEEKFRALQREIEKTENQLRNLERQSSRSNVAIEKMRVISTKVGETAGKIGDTMMPVSLAIGAAGVASIKMASDMNESLNKVDVAFGKSSGEVIKWSDTTLKNFGIAKGTSLDMIAGFGDMGTAMGFTQQQAAKMGEALVGRAGDLSSFKNISTDVAKNALTGIFSGETESLKQLGVIMTQTNLQQFAYSNGIKKKIGDMSQAELVQLRYNYVMEKTKNAEGDFAKTAGGTANSTRIFQESLKQLAATFGQTLLPIITPIIQKVTELITKLSEMSPHSQKLIVGALGIVAAIGPLAKLIQGVTIGFNALLGVIGFIATPVGAVVAVIAALTAGIVYLWNTNTNFRNAVINIWQGIQQFFSNTIAFFSNFFSVQIPGFIRGAISWFQQLPSRISSAFSSALTTISNWGTGVWNYFSTNIPRWINGVFTWFNQLPGRIGQALGFAIGTLTRWGINTWTYLSTNVPRWINGIGTWFSQLPSRIGTWLSNTYSRAVSWGSQMFSKAMEVGSRFISNIGTWLSQLPSRVGTWLSSTISRAVSFVSQFGQKASEAASRFGTNIVNGIKSIPEKVVSIGRNIVEGIWHGISNGASWLSDKIHSFASGVVSGFEKAMGIKSPSTVMSDRIGKFMAQGVGVGFTDELDSVKSNMSSTMSNLANSDLVRVFNNNINLQGNVNQSNMNQNQQPIVVQTMLDGKLLSETLVSVLDQLNGKRLNLTERGVLT